MSANSASGYGLARMAGPPTSTTSEMGKSGRLLFSFQKQDFAEDQRRAGNGLSQFSMTRHTGILIICSYALVV